MAIETSTTPELGQRRIDWVGVGVGGAAVLFVVVFSIRMIIEYRRFAINAFDFGIFDQGLWLLSRFETPFSTVRGLSLFGDHSSYIMLPLAPLYWVLPYAETLLILTVVVMAVGGPLAYLAARAVGAPRFMAALVGIGYLAHPAVGWNARDGFHPEQFVLPLLIAAFLLFARDRDRWAVALVIIALLAKEDVAMVVVPFALFVWWYFGKRRQALIMGAVAVAAMVVSFGFLIPHFSPTGELLYAYRYADLGQGVFGIVSGLVLHPEVLFAALSDPARIGYLAVLVLPIPLALFEPRALLIAVPATVANLVSTHSYQYQVQYHYTIYLLVAVVIAAVIGAARVPRWKEGRRVEFVVGVSIIAALGFGAASPLASEWANPSPDQDAAREAIALIPPDATVSAWNTYVPHLTHRRIVYQFPNPWQRHNYSAPSLPLPDPATVDWVLVREGVNEDVVADLIASNEFEVMYRESPVLLLRRISG
ncbi:MAG: hypothetical protein BMS9Abin07_1962 [Acidimicrobiia bacterium]|nr:MAG: hypothetical protein BMS9Abin07_1962 [Acidimicrobiia bacterium]